ncbi:hypothetical protein O7614_16640 [Micromonospora sp. WMMD961]|uniref:hypothetical protein n=1 Tax=Micromonospora sp. WMMD961 TaxID=3016100 RepID=UPI0024160EB3|nr:hypothetical protein [Micromonospora sp. WMMD961]MDG4781279.1 hypothetical protein [Micromonospora sp. WMMD961]
MVRPPAGALSIEADADGLTFRLRGFATRLPWESVESLTVVKTGESGGRGNREIRLRVDPRLAEYLAQQRRITLTLSGRSWSCGG